MKSFKKKKKNSRVKKDYYTKKVFLLDIIPFETDLIVYVNYTKDDMLKHLKKTAKPNVYKKFIERYNIEEESEGKIYGTMYEIGGGFLITLNVDKDKFRMFIGTVVHEISHVVHYLLRNRRIPLEENTEEIYTYLTEYLTEQVLMKSY